MTGKTRVIQMLSTGVIHTLSTTRQTTKEEVPAVFDLDRKTFHIISNDGPGTEVNEETVFHFRQQEDIAHADYAGGGVRFGKLLGIISGAAMTHRYIQVNQRGEFQAGRSTVVIEQTANGKLRLIDTWTWEDGRGSGRCIFAED